MRLNSFIDDIHHGMFTSKSNYDCIFSSLLTFNEFSFKMERFKNFHPFNLFNIIYCFWSTIKPLQPNIHMLFLQFDLCYDVRVYINEGCVYSCEDK